MVHYLFPSNIKLSINFSGPPCYYCTFFRKRQCLRIWPFLVSLDAKTQRSLLLGSLTLKLALKPCSGHGTPPTACIHQLHPTPPPKKRKKMAGERRRQFTAGCVYDVTYIRSHWYSHQVVWWSHKSRKRFQTNVLVVQPVHRNHTEMCNSFKLLHSRGQFYS
jgi:hypothetical protein